MKTTECEIIKRIEKIHGNKYSFDKFKYLSYKHKVILICQIHGEFNISLSNLIGNKRGCPECGKLIARDSCRSNNEEFISKANKVHDFKYGYDNVEYYNWVKKVIINCPFHGDFMQSPNSHLNGSGCAKCNKGRPKVEKKEKHNKYEIGLEKKKDFITESNKIHNNKYDYSGVEYIASNKKVKILCEKHGEFEQTPTHHKRGNGCPLCAYYNSFGPRIKTFDFISISKKMHNNYYTYGKSIYTSNKDKIVITCPVHGDFKQLPKYHMNGGGCSKCNIGRHGKGIGNTKLKYNTNEFIEICNNIFDKKYDYSCVIFKGVKRKVSVICSIHGSFNILAYNHMNGTECKECSINKQKRKKIDLISELNLIHNSKYTYIIDNHFISTVEKINIICPEHGLFRQALGSHLRGSGCMLCKTRSKGEISIKNVLEKYNINYISEKSFDSRLRFDFWLPNLNTIIEFDGKHHFQSIEYFGGESTFKKVILNDQLKNDYCKNNKIFLIRINYKDFKKIEEIIKNEIIKNVKLQT